MKDISLEDVLVSDELSLIVRFVNYAKKTPNEKEYEYLR